MNQALRPNLNFLRCGLPLIIDVVLPYLNLIFLILFDTGILLFSHMTLTHALRGSHACISAS